jgi:3-oxoacyl-[acyl-carrier protein] reductase
MTSTRKSAIVTGSATGVGAAVAIQLAERGCNVVVNYTRSEQEARETAAVCESHGVEAEVVQADVSDDEACRRLAAAAAGRWGRIDYLVNNAAKTKFNPYEKLDGLDAQDFLDIYAVNVVGAYQMVRAVEPHMRKTGCGAVVNNSSIGGVTGIASSMAYAASKAALNMMTRSLAHVLAPEIRINACVPGMIKTRWLKAGMGDEAYEAMLENVTELLPLKYVASADDIAEVIVWLLEGARVVTGETLIADSGIHLGQLPPSSSENADW